MGNLAKKQSTGTYGEHARQNERERLYAMFNDAPGLIVKLRGSEHIVEFANAVYYHLYPDNNGSDVGKPIREALSGMPDLDPEIFDAMDYAYTSGETFYCKEADVLLQPSIDAEPQHYYFDTVYQPTFDEKGCVEGVLVYANDVTELVAARREAEKTAALKHAMMFNTSTAHFIVDDSGVCTFMNPGAKELVGKSAEKDIGRKKLLGDIFMCQQRFEGKVNECKFRRAIASRQEAKGEEILVNRLNGKSFPASLRSSPIQSQELGGAVVRIRDITQEKEEKRRKAELETITRERNALARLNRSKDEFIGTASHQLRTPATAVKQYASFLKDGFAGDLTDTQQEYAEQAYQSNERQLYVINGLLKIAQIDSDRYSLHQQSVGVKEIVALVKEETKLTLAAKNQTLEIHDQTKKDAEFCLDKNEINAVLANLVDNASKYSPAGSTITLRTKQTDKYLTLAVSDEGVGIAPANQRRIFEKFTRVDNKYSKTVTGSGLGLYLANQIVNLHGGSFKVISKSGHGSTFTVSLPIADCY